MKMRSRNVSLIVVGGLSIALIVSVIISAVVIKKSPNRKRLEKVYNSILDKDREILTTGLGSEQEIYHALTRLGRMKDPVAKDAAIQKLSSATPFIRSAAYLTLGHFNESAINDLLAKGTEDPDLSVRQAALRAMGYANHEFRIHFLKSKLSEANVSEVEKGEIYESLARIAPHSQRDLTEKLLQTASKGDDEAQANALINAAQMSPRNPQVLLALKNKIRSSKNSKIVTFGIHHLASLHDQWLRSNFAWLTTHPSPQVRAAAFQRLHEICPKERWTLLEKALDSEKDLVTQISLVNTAKMISGGEALGYLRKAKEKFSGKKELASLVEDLIKNLQEHPQNSSCLD